MKERPILFSTDMVQAILDGRKTETRRIHKNQNQCKLLLKKAYDFEVVKLLEKNPFGNKGDVLWVRESFVIVDDSFCLYKQMCHVPHKYKWKPSIHLPKKFARIYLQLTSNPTIERLHDISEGEALNEGVSRQKFTNNYKNYDHQVRIPFFNNARLSFFSLWTKINGYDSFCSNPYVWVLRFKVLSTTGRPTDILDKEVPNA